MNIFCKKCGKEIDGNNEFCSECEMKLGGEVLIFDEKDNQALENSIRFIEFVKNLFKGRLGRLDFLILLLGPMQIFFVFIGLLSYAIELLGGNLSYDYAVKGYPSVVMLVYFVISIACFLIITLLTFSALTRRLHDMGLSGFWSLVVFFPYLGLLILSLVLLVSSGNAGINKYGEVNNKKSLLRRIFNIRGDGNNEKNEVDKSSQLSILWLILIPPALFLSAFSVFMFDAPGSERNIFTILIAISLFTATPSLLLGSIGGYLKKKGIGKVILGGIVYLPFVNLILFIASLLILIFFCNGKFNCQF